MALTWTEEYSVGVKELDDHHQKFLSTWFTIHIMTVDKKYIPYFTEKCD